ncbi:PRP38 family-domain-containing protein [Kickxella alabastrina]|uniref:PRP38 family-domain-containing protein n=1 Tax=Kickxella alabastrina TaxID=61397 RepID=UPI002220577A|nr:PRP38 family-domain-containing protein [Kickxella alabastrina]KAI7822420.1 PRP38 family-domain-containing protein [Kickxella alabastrina]
MANRTNLIDKEYRQRIYDSLYWKEHFTGVMDKAVNLTCIGGCFGDNKRPTEFMCLMVDALIDQNDFKYMRALALMYFRLTERPVDVYTKLELLYNDYSKLRRRIYDGTYVLMHMDELEQRVCSIALPRITDRRKLEDVGELPPRISPLDQNDSDSDSESESSSGSQQGLNLRGQRPTDFKSVALTTRPY